MKFLKKAIAGAVRFATSFGFMFCALIAVGAICIVESLKPSQERLESLAEKIEDPRFRSWQASIETEQEKAALRIALDAYARMFGSAVWARHASEELAGSGAPRFFDLARLAISIDKASDTLEFAKSHADVYAVIVASGAEECAEEYVKTLCALRARGGEEWSIACANPSAVAVFAAIGADDGLWKWYLANRDWVDDYVVAMSPDVDSENPGDVLSGAINEFRRRARVYRALRDETLAASEAADAEEKGAIDLDAHAFLVYALGTISLYGELFEVVCDADIPFGQALDVFANNFADLNLATGEDRRKAGVEMANIYRSHRVVWDAACVPGGEGALRYFRDVPAFAEKVLSLFGEAGVLPFLMQNYAESSDLLRVASEALSRYEEVGWTVLAAFAGNGEFNRALLTDGVGHLVVPYVVLKGGESSAIAECLNDPGWVKRYLNEDGSIKEETQTIVEAMPFVGGIATVLKHKMRGEPVTMGEIGWAAFDVVDDVATLAAIAGSVAAAPVTGGASLAGGATVVAAKEAAIQSAKQTAKLTVKQAGTQIAKTTAKGGAKAGAKLTVKHAGSVIVRDGVAKAAGAEAKSFARETLIKTMAKKALGAGAWTLRLGERAFRLGINPVAKTATAWRRLPPHARLRLLKAANAAMFCVAIFERTLPKIGPATRNALKGLGRMAGEVAHEAVLGAAEGFAEAVKASLGVSEESSVRPFYVALAALCFCIAIFLFRRRRRFSI